MHSFDKRMRRMLLVVIAATASCGNASDNKQADIAIKLQSVVVAVCACASIDCAKTVRDHATTLAKDIENSMASLPKEKQSQLVNLQLRADACETKLQAAASNAELKKFADIEAKLSAAASAVCRCKTLSCGQRRMEEVQTIAASVTGGSGPGYDRYRRTAAGATRNASRCVVKLTRKKP